ncbi:MAG: EFR1 family ferrodoxin [Erysipelotrichaceae bacterium]|nr:EFR1 family ferrodoxin [Erysipelotrichaceae bacterium]
MILYFSATGNSQYVAEMIANETHDFASSILDVKHIQIMDQCLGFVFPTYLWGLPSIVDEYMRNAMINVSDHTYIYFVATYGTTSGQTGKFMEKHLENKGLNLSAKYSIKIVDSYTPIFDLSNQDKINKIQQKENPQIQEIINHINHKDTGDYMHNKVPMPLVKMGHLVYEPVRRTKHLHVENTCIGCGLCAMNCPIQAIEMKNNQPTWIKDKCVMCLRCLHHCPHFAIQYGNTTQKHGQYKHPL